MDLAEPALLAPLHVGHSISPEICRQSVQSAVSEGSLRLSWQKKVTLRCVLEQEGGIEDDEEGGLQAPLLLQAVIDEILF